ncbi:MAG: argininosuccinate lyase [Vicinamibacterales bacterium]
MRFAPEYVSLVLNENFEDAKTLFLSPLLAIHYAHLVMLADRGLLAPGDARRLRAALDSVSEHDVRRKVFDGACEDLFFYVEGLIAAGAGEDTAGRLHVARSRNDVDMTMYRMRQREFVLDLVQATLDLRTSLIDVARRHVHTIFPAHTHTQPAQPTTVAHYFLGAIEQLERDVVRLRAAYDTTNRNPLGSCAITGTGFDIDRHLTSALLGFSGPTGNTYGSIATVDYLLESLSATAVTLTGLGRMVQDLLLWCTVEVGYLRLGDGFVQSSSIMPQKRNPVALEHARAIGSRALGQCLAVTMAAHNTPFGDIVDTEDDLQPLVHAAFRDATRALRLVAAAVGDARFDEARMALAADEGGTTMTELADTLTREHALPFRTSHAVAAAFAAHRAAHPTTPLAEALAEASRAVLGHAVDYDETKLTAVLGARHFVAIRRTLGGPAPEETTRALGEAATRLADDRAWLAGTREALAHATRLLHERAAAL